MVITITNDLLHLIIIIIIIIIIPITILTLTTVFHRLTRHRTSAVKTPCPHSHPLIGNLIAFLRHRHRFHDWVSDMLASTPSLTLKVAAILLRPPGVCTADPAAVDHLLRHNFRNYVKGRRYTAVLQELLGGGIFNSDGTLWSSQRKIASHEFNTKSLRNFISHTVNHQIITSLIPHLSSTQDVTIDLQQVFKKFSFDNVCNVAFGIDPCLLTSNSSDSNYLSFVKAFDFAVEHVSNRFMSPVPFVWKLKRYFNVGNEKRFKQSIETINQFAMDVIESKESKEKRIGGNVNEDLLSRFMASSYDMGFEEDERRKFLRDIIISFILAGKDSTSTALTWFFWLLDGHPHCKNLICKEFTLLSSSSSSLSSLTFDDLKNLNYLHAALSESMRLFPPVPINSRLTVEDDILPNGTFVGKGWFADYSAYAMGRMERLWGSDCQEFKPERWLDGDGVFRPVDQYKYPVFHGGFRMCLGKEMAYLQMKAVVVAVLSEFEVKVVGGGGSPERMADPPYGLSLVLSMKNGLPVRVKKRV